MAVTVAITSATTAPMAMSIWPPAMAPHTMAARKNRPVSGLFWKMT